MKKIENILYVPAVILLFLGISKKNTAVTDIHFSDTYYVVANTAIAGIVLAWLIIAIIFFKLIRRRHQDINLKFAAPYIILTLGLYLVFTLANPAQVASGGMSDAQLDRWMFYNRLRAWTATTFILVQVIFLIYAVVQLMRRPRYHV